MIYAIATIYNPSKENIKNLEEIKSQVDCLIVCDNSNKSYKSEISFGIKYYHENRNLGLSQAFNVPLKSKEFKWNSDDYIIFFDQDSTIDAGYIKRIVCEYEKCSHHDIKIGCLGPVFYNSSNNRIEKTHDGYEMLPGVFETKRIITSSMICKYNVLQEVGFWNEGVFLDMADWDLCWRMQEAGYKCLMTENVTLHHSIGITEKKIGLLHLRVGNPIREYYEIRDCLYLAQKKYTPFQYKIRFLLMIFVRSPIHVFFYNERRKRFHYIIRGIYDFFLGKHGEYIDA